MTEYKIKFLAEYFTNKLIISNAEKLPLESEKLNRLRHLLDLEIKARLSLLTEDVTFEDVERTLKGNVNIDFYINII